MSSNAGVYVMNQDNANPNCNPNPNMYVMN